MLIPKTFRERYSGLVDEPDAFFSSLEKYPPKSFRVNTLKAEPGEILERFSGYGIGTTAIPWYEHGFISDFPDIGGTLEHFLGKIYLQETVSMIPPVLVRKELEKADYALDACAAPGSKTTQMAALMSNRGTLVANDVSYERIKALKFNLEKTGSLNTVITNVDFRRFPNSEYPIILLDAPCSAEGTIRRHEKFFSSWNEKIIKKNSALQKDLILRAFDLLGPGGVLVYSTCTFAPEENELVVSHLLDSREAKTEKISLEKFRLSKPLSDWEGQEFHEDVRNTARIWPHHNDTGGFFLAKVRK